MDSYERNDLLVVLALFCAILLGMYGTYRLGRYLERRSYAPFLAKAFQETYTDGFYDGHKLEEDACRQSN